MQVHNEFLTNLSDLTFFIYHDLHFPTPRFFHIIKLDLMVMAIVGGFIFYSCILFTCGLPKRHYALDDYYSALNRTRIILHND